MSIYNGLITDLKCYILLKTLHITVHYAFKVTVLDLDFVAVQKVLNDLKCMF